MDEKLDQSLEQCNSNDRSSHSMPKLKKKVNKIVKKNTNFEFVEKVKIV